MAEVEDKNPAEVEEGEDLEDGEIEDEDEEEVPQREEDAAAAADDERQGDERGDAGQAIHGILPSAVLPSLEHADAPAQKPAERPMKC